MKEEKQYKVGDIYRWQGIRNCDTKTIDGGYLFFVTDIDKNGNITSQGKRIDKVKNRSEAIKKYLLNPKNPNNHNFVIK